MIDIVRSSFVCVTAFPSRRKNPLTVALSKCLHIFLNLYCLCQFSLLSVRLREVVHAREGVWMIVSQDHLSLCQHFLIHLCCLCQFSLLSVPLCEVVHARDGVSSTGAVYHLSRGHFFRNLCVSLITLS